MKESIPITWITHLGWSILSEEKFVAVLERDRMMALACLVHI
jgi:hypothetical protein